MPPCPIPSLLCISVLLPPSPCRLSWVFFEGRASKILINAPTLTPGISLLLRIHSPGLPHCGLIPYCFVIPPVGHHRASEQDDVNPYLISRIISSYVPAHKKYFGLFHRPASDRLLAPLLPFPAPKNILSYFVVPRAIPTHPSFLRVLQRLLVSLSSFPAPQKIFQVISSSGERSIAYVSFVMCRAKNYFKLFRRPASKVQVLLTCFSITITSLPHFLRIKAAKK
ncbi:hypothetical protein B0H10DRAFT_1940317 [Mycena sp. CBHHK59/15]|nr:hypothetical protein B0H10DRAFT_1940317 [Mycena sp. CBHHK59/15]